MDRDRNLLFGVFAVQLRKVTPSQIMEAASAWASNPSRDLADRLVEEHDLAEDDRLLIDKLVEQAVDVHGGDVGATLASLGGNAQVERSFHGSVSISPTGGVETTIRSVSPAGKQTQGVEETSGRYSQVGETARGGMGRILLVHDEFLGRDVALKELLPELASTTDGKSAPSREGMSLLSRFLQEARITGQLEHPSIVPVYELGHRTDGTVYYTMKLVRGDTLEEAISSARDLKSRLGLLNHFIDLCQGVAYAHSLNIIHRDIKPANVMVGKFGETVVLDWGLAKLKDKEDLHVAEIKETLRVMNLGEDDAVGTTKYGDVMGTPLYMPPEQAKGQLDQINERSDVYSLGAVLYEMLTGEPPFSAKSPKAILEQVISEEPRSVQEREPDVPAELAAICTKALSKKPANRYPTAKALADEIQRFQSGALVQAHEYTTSQLVKRWVQRNKPLVATAAAAAAVLLIVSGLYVVNINRANRDLRLSRDAEAAQRIEAVEARDAEAAQRARAEETVAELERAQYVSMVRLAENHLEDDDVILARERLDAAPKQHRNWEWGYLYRDLDNSIQTMTGHTGWVADGAFSPDGTRIATASTDGTAKLWDVNTGEEVSTLEGHSKSVHKVVFSSGGTRVLTAAQDNTARLWDSTTGEEIYALSSHSGVVRSAVLSPDDTRIVTASDDRTAKLWDAQTGEEVFTLKGHVDSVRSAAFSPDGTRVVTASEDRTAKLWDVTTGEILNSFEGHTAHVSGAVFDPDGARVVTASEDGTARLWDTATGEALIVFSMEAKPGESGIVDSALFSPDGTRVLTNHRGVAVRLWNAITGKPVADLAGNPIRTAEFNSDGSRIVTSSSNETVQLWDAASGELLSSLKGHTGPVVSASFSLDGTRVLSTSWDQTAKLWEASENVITLKGHPGPVLSASFSPDGTRVLTASYDDTARLWDAETGEEIREIRARSGGVGSAMFSPDGARFVTGGRNTHAKVWDTATGDEVVTLKGHSAGITSAEFSPDGTRVLTSSNDMTAKLWDAVTAELLTTLIGHAETTELSGFTGVYSAVFNSDGTRILTAASDATAKLWDAATGEELVTIKSDDGQVIGANFSPDGTRVATSTSRAAVKLWDATTGEELKSFKGHTNVVPSVVFSPDGTRLLSASWDNTVRLWDAETGVELLVLEGHTDRAQSAVFNPDGTRIVTASWDGTARLWDAAP